VLVRASGNNIEIIEAPVDDIWMRDIALALHCATLKWIAIGDKRTTLSD
jgi:hypothetical protein